MCVCVCVYMRGLCVYLQCIYLAVDVEEMVPADPVSVKVLRLSILHCL